MRKMVEKMKRKRKNKLRGIVKTTSIEVIQFFLCMFP